MARDWPPVAVTGWGADYPDPDSFLHPQLGWNDYGWRHEGFEELVEKARQTLNHSERLEILQQADTAVLSCRPAQHRNDFARGHRDGHAVANLIHAEFAALEVFHDQLVVSFSSHPNNLLAHGLCFILQPGWYVAPLLRVAEVGLHGQEVYYTLKVSLRTDGQLQR